MSLENFLPLRREIIDHWIYQDNDYFKIWVEMLFRARFSEEPKKDIYEGSLYTINQGEFLFSRPKWSQRIKVNQNKMYKLVNLLIKDEMITKTGRVGKSGASIYLINNYKKYNNYNNQPTTLIVENSGVKDYSQQPTNSEATTKQQPTNSEATLKKKEKKEKREKSVKNVINNKEYDYIDSIVKNESLANALKNYVDMRKNIKSPMTLNAIKLLIGKLNRITPDVIYQTQLVEDATVSNWKSVYETKKPIVNNNQSNNFSSVLEEMYNEEA